MATPTLVPISEYLSRTYQPDREYVDGVVVERNLGERDHSRVQALLAAYFIGNEDDWQVVALVEQRVQVSSTRFRIPDVCLLAADDPDDPIVHKAPLSALRFCRAKIDSLPSKKRSTSTSIWVSETYG